MNKTADHHRHIFNPPNMQKIPFRRMKAFVFQNILSSENFDNFPKIKFYWFLQKPSIYLKKRYFQEMKSIYTHFTANLPPFTDFKKIKFFPEKKKQTSYAFEKSYYFIPILRQICYNFVTENFQIQNCAILLESWNWQVNEKNGTGDKKTFLYIITMAENNNFQYFDKTIQIQSI